MVLKRKKVKVRNNLRPHTSVNIAESFKSVLGKTERAIDFLDSKKNS